MYNKPKFKKGDLIISNNTYIIYINNDDFKNKTIYKIKDICSGSITNCYFYKIEGKDNLIYSTGIIDNQYCLYER